MNKKSDITVVNGGNAVGWALGGLLFFIGIGVLIGFAIWG